MRFGFRQMKNEDISVFIDEMFEILASNMSAVAPTGNSYDEDYKTWSESAVPAWREGKRSVILIFCEDKLCGFFQYFVNDRIPLQKDILYINQRSVWMIW